MITLRVLTVTDLHQSCALGEQLLCAVQTHQPDLVAVVGDVLGLPEEQAGRFTPWAWARFLAALPVAHLVFTRGNHDQEEWGNFVYAWPHEKRPLIALHGTAHAFGPLVVVGFPCHIGWEGPWRARLPKAGNVVTLDPNQSGRKSLPEKTSRWLRPLLRGLGPAGRTLWLMHEPPLAAPIAHSRTCNPEWTAAVARHQPLLTVSGHDHDTPRRTARWHMRLGESRCVNVGQGVETLHYTLIEFDFAANTPCLPMRILVRAFPAGDQIEINPVNLIP